MAPEDNIQSSKYFSLFFSYPEDKFWELLYFDLKKLIFFRGTLSNTPLPASAAVERLFTRMSDKLFESHQELVTVAVAATIVHFQYLFIHCKYLEPFQNPPFTSGDN